MPRGMYPLEKALGLKFSHHPQVIGCDSKLTIPNHKGFSICF
ncbi:hypothetical protein LEP1GSC199_1768 [Leptospira vanthielii serovar Holland str. Waz Holland = ATCC 700522]|uniref:Uncharacterized protein n=1 Tax=Leptospira vanthielii serovar Holland str. Waz Holland = ATCC 700522 TaxID=1218591 RepID=N1WAG1_9LEPT|nr:hypothetical protein LEP1GSC199_1768 [Leptospira vanthielii serovar Holland str. Waz Holland = ATCC 700522]